MFFTSKVEILHVISFSKTLDQQTSLNKQSAVKEFQIKNHKSDLDMNLVALSGLESLFAFAIGLAAYPVR
jgi:hypothetical protein